MYVLEMKDEDSCPSRASDRHVVKYADTVREEFDRWIAWSDRARDMFMPELLFSFPPDAADFRRPSCSS